MRNKTVFLCAVVSCLSISAAFSQDTTAPAPSEKFYLKEGVSLVTDSGVTSLVPGTEVTKVGGSGAGCKVKSKDGVLVSVKETQLTQDPNFAQNLIAQETQKQAAIQAEKERHQTARDQAVKRAEIAASQTAASSPAYVATPAPAPALERSPVQYEARDAGVTVHPPVIKKKKK